MPSNNLIKRDWEKDHVYLIQYPRCAALPNASPWSLKLETFLRLAEIPYTNINNGFKSYSKRGQVPFIELNGRQHSDSNIIIEKLKEEFNKKDIDTTDPEKKAILTAIHAMVENSLVWVPFAYRRNDPSWLLSDDGWGRALGTGMKKRLMHCLTMRKMKKLLTFRTLGQGIARLSDEEIEALAKEELDSLSTLLGNKPFFNGDKPATIDCNAFAVLAGFIYTPMPGNVLTKYVTETKANLGEFVQRMRERLWPDWEETCSTQNMNTHKEKEKKESE